MLFEREMVRGTFDMKKIPNLSGDKAVSFTFNEKTGKAIRHNKTKEEIYKELGFLD